MNLGLKLERGTYEEMVPVNTNREEPPCVALSLRLLLSNVFITEDIQYVRIYILNNFRDLL